MTPEQEDLDHHVLVLKRLLEDKRKEVEDLEKRWIEARRKARGDWSAESFRINKTDLDL